MYWIRTEVSKFTLFPLIKCPNEFLHCLPMASWAADTWDYSDEPDRAQDVIRCDICDFDDPDLYCNTCTKSLCKSCTGEHASLRPLTKHDIVRFEYRNQMPSVINCARHPLFTCELFCKQCKTAVCSKCISSKYHQKHALTELSGIFPSKIKEIEKDLENIEKYILPEYNTLKTQLKMCLKVKLYLIDTKRFGKTFDNKRRSRYRKLNPKWKLYCPRWIYQTPTSKRRVAKYC